MYIACCISWPLQLDFLSDNIIKLSGIVNGCTDFMLSSVNGKGLSSQDASA